CGAGARTRRRGRRVGTEAWGRGGRVGELRRLRAETSRAPARGATGGERPGRGTAAEKRNDGGGYERYLEDRVLARPLSEHRSSPFMRLPLLVEFTLPFRDPVLIVALVLLVILVVPLLFRRFRIPGLIGLIVAGVAVGPNAANLLDRDPTMILLGTVGLLYLMFLAGLEINLNLFARHRNRSLVFGAFTF